MDPGSFLDDGLIGYLDGGWGQHRTIQDCELANPDHNLPQASQGPMAQWTCIHVYMFTIFFLYIYIIWSFRPHKWRFEFRTLVLGTSILFMLRGGQKDHGIVQALLLVPTITCTRIRSMIRRKLKSWWSNPLQRSKCPTGKPFGGYGRWKKSLHLSYFENMGGFLWGDCAISTGADFFPSTRAEQWVARARVQGRFFATKWGNKEAQNTQGLCFIFTNLVNASGLFLG